MNGSQNNSRLWCFLLALCSGIGAVFADLAGSITLYRLHRVGYEILNDGLPAGDEFSFWSENGGLILAVTLLVLSMAAALSFAAVRHNVRRFFNGCRNWFWRKFEYVVLVIMIIGAIIGGVCLFKDEIRKFQLAIGGWRFYDSAPGWKYPNQVSDRVRTILMDRLKSVKGDLQTAVDSSGYLMEPSEYTYWRDSEHHYERERVRIMTKVLSESGYLRRRCRGIPIEWLVDNIRFKTRNVPNATGGTIWAEIDNLR